MSKVDDELTRRLHGAERPVDVDAVFEGLERRRSHRERVRRVQAGLLAIAVLLASSGTFLSLRAAFGPDQRQLLGGAAFGAEGAIVACGDTTGQHLCRIDARALLTGATPDDVIRLTDLPGESVSMPSVSPNGTEVVFDRFDPGTGATSLWIVGVDGTRLRRLSADGAGLTNASWGPDGSLVAVAAAGTSPSGEPAAFAILDPTRAPTPIVRTIALPGLSFPSTPRFSPDGKQILFAAGEDSNSTGSHVYTVTTDGGRVTDRGGTGAMTPDWSPDGQQIVFSAGTVNGVELFVCPLDCSSPRPLQDGSGATIDGGLPRWSPDGHWISYQTEEGGNSVLNVVLVDETTVQGLASRVAELAWIPSVEDGSPQPSAEREPTPSVGLRAQGRDVGLGFNLCDTHRLRGIDFLGDGTPGTAWTGTKIKADGTCPDAYDDRYGVAADITGDGLADLWSGESIEYCGGCEPLKGFDVNGDGREELLVVLQYFTIMQYGVYTVVDADGGSQLVPFRVGAPGHPEHGLDPGKPFSFWIGGDAGLSDWFYCESLPTFWLTSTESPIDPGPDDLKTVHRTHVSLMTDGIAHILFADTYTVPAETDLQLPYTSPDHSDPDCGIGVKPG
jgi:hypothetical protein